MHVKNPFKALQSYQESDKEYFYGRSKEISILINRIEQNRLNILYGVSGAGKSSLINAGLGPHLQQNFVIINLPIAAFFKSEKSAYHFVLDLLTEEAGKKGLKFSRSSKMRTEKTLWEFFHKVSFKDPKSKKEFKPLIILDQFEALFLKGNINHRYTPEAIDLLNELSSIIEDIAPESELSKLEDKKEYYQWLMEPINARVLITLRSDYLSNLETLCKKIPTICNGAARFQLQLFNSKQVTEVISKAGAHFFEESAIEQIKINIAKVSWHDKDGQDFKADLFKYQPFLLSIYCHKLVKERYDGKKLTYVELVHDSLDNFLNDFYEELTKPLNNEVKEFLERLIVGDHRKLLHIEERKDYIKEEGIEELRKLKLVNEIVFKGQTYLELTHDILVKPVRYFGDKRRAKSAKTKNRRNLLGTGVTAALAMTILVYIGLKLEIEYDAFGLRNNLIQEQLTKATTQLKDAFDDLEKKNDSISALGYSAIANAAIFQNSDATKALRYAQLSRKHDKNGLLSKSSLFNTFTPNGKFYKTTPLQQLYTHILYSKKYNKLVLHGYRNKMLIMDSLGIHVKSINTVDSIASVDISPSQDYIFVLTKNGKFQIRAFDGKQTSKGVLPKKTNSYQNKCLFLSGTLVAVTYNSSLCIVSAKTGSIIAQQILPSEINALDIDQGKITVAYGNTIQIFSLFKGKLVREFDYSLNNNTVINHIDYSPRLDRIAVACQDQVARLIILDSVNQVSQVLPLIRGESKYTNYKLSFVKFSPNGESLITAGTESRDNLSHWEKDGKWKADLIGHYFRIKSVSFSKDSKYCLTSSADNNARLWNLRNATSEDLEKHDATVYYATFLGNNQSIMTVSKDYSAIYWYLNRKGLQESNNKNPFAIRYMEPNASHDEFLIVGSKKIAYLNSRLNYSEIQTKDNISEAHFSIYHPNHLIIRVNDKVYIANKNDLSDANEIELNPAIPKIIELKVSNSGRFLIINSELEKNKKYRINIYDFKKRQLMPFSKDVKNDKKERYFIIGIAPNDSTLAYSMYDELFKWNFINNNQQQLLRDSLCVIKDFKYADDGSKLLMTCYNNNLKLFDQDSLGNPVNAVRISGHKARVQSASFSQSNSRLVSTANDRKIRIWDLKGNLLADIEKATISPQAFFFCDDEKIISWDRNKNFRTWHYELGPLEQKFNWCDSIIN